MKIRDERSPIHVSLPCGCDYVAFHIIGDRIYRCEHKRDWVIHAIPPSEVTYETHELGARGGGPVTVDVQTKDGLF